MILLKKRKRIDRITIQTNHENKILLIAFTHKMHFGFPRRISTFNTENSFSNPDFPIKLNGCIKLFV